MGNSKLTPRITQVTLTPGTLYDAMAWTITVLDEAAGEFLEVRELDTGGAIRIDAGEWPALRGQIDRMFASISGSAAAEEHERLDALSVCMGDPDEPIKTGCEWDEDDEDAPYDPPDGWIPWEGGECPVSGDTVVVIKTRAGSCWAQPACYLIWDHDGFSDDIIAYKVVSEEKDD